jgi:hypothetical protein
MSDFYTLTFSGRFAGEHEQSKIHAELIQLR